VKLIPAPWPVLHTPRGVETVLDAHGNDHLVDGDPVIRYVVALYQNGYKTGMASKEMFSEEYLLEIKTDLMMVIPHDDIKAQSYQGGDQVLIGGSVSGGDYVGGTAFRLHGLPGSDLEGPWPHLYKSFGGVVRVSRVN
jgi:hypothetical protein